MSEEKVIVEAMHRMTGEWVELGCIPQERLKTFTARERIQRMAEKSENGTLYTMSDPSASVITDIKDVAFIPSAFCAFRIKGTSK